MKKNCRKKARERYQNITKEEKEKSGNMVVNIDERQKMKSKGLLSIRKQCIIINIMTL